MNKTVRKGAIQVESFAGADLHKLFALGNAALN
jgi:hypothetical protein